MGTTAIIVCLTSSVPQIAAKCRDMLQIPQFASNVVEAIGTREAVSVTVSGRRISNTLQNQIHLTVNYPNFFFDVHNH